jgi:hypothetical protein
MVQDRHSKSNGQGQGQKWIRNERRVALYLRDGLACAYCSAAVEDGIVLTLDHLVAHSLGRDNSNQNLVTACRRCNASRGNRDWRKFATTVAAYLNHGITAHDIISHIETTVQRPVDVKQAKEIIAARGGFTQALRR